MAVDGAGSLMVNHGLRVWWGKHGGGREWIIGEGVGMAYIGAHADLLSHRSLFGNAGMGIEIVRTI